MRMLVVNFRPTPKANEEYTRSHEVLPQRGHAIFVSAERTSFSNFSPHFSHMYSYIGMAPPPSELPPNGHRRNPQRLARSTYTLSNRSPAGKQRPVSATNCTVFIGGTII
jgi:hypothetical protein